MSDRWLKLSTSLAEHPKFRLRVKSDRARVAFIIALCKAKDAGGDGRFESREHLELALGAYAGDTVDELIEAGLIDELPETGELWIHDFEERQRPLTNAERQAEWRRRNGVGRSPNRDEGGSGGGGGGRSPHGDNGVDNSSRNADVTPDVTSKVTRIRGVGDREDVYTREIESVIRMFEGIIRKPPSERTIAALQRMTRDHGADLMCDALRFEAALGGTNDLLKRTGRRIRRDAKERSDQYEEARSRSEAERAKLEAELPAGMTEEEAEERRNAVSTFIRGFGSPQGEA